MTFSNANHLSHTIVSVSRQAYGPILFATYLDREAHSYVPVCAAVSAA